MPFFFFFVVFALAYVKGFSSKRIALEADVLQHWKQTCYSTGSRRVTALEADVLQHWKIYHFEARFCLFASFFLFILFLLFHPIQIAKHLQVTTIRDCVADMRGNQPVTQPEGWKTYTHTPSSGCSSCQKM